LYEDTVFPPFTEDAVIVAAPFPKARPVPTFAAEAVGACGTVVANTAADAEEAADVPAALVAVTVNVGVADEAIPVTVNGEDDPVAVWPVLAVTVKDVALGESAGKEKDTDTAALLNALPVPTSVPVTFIGANGSKKSFDAWDFLPILLPDAIVNLLISY
jgi:hypothetical protein